MKTGAYVLHLYCDHPGCHWKAAEYTGEDRRGAFRVARLSGWHIGKPWNESDYCGNHKNAHKAERKK